MDSPWLNDSQYAVWRKWLRVSTELPTEMNRQLQNDSGMSIQDFEILVRLSEADEDMLRIGALAEQATWERSRLSHHLGRMEKRGLVVRTSCAQDGRGTYVQLTEQGRTALDQAAPGHARFVRGVMFDHMTEDQLSVLGEIATGILERINDPDVREAAAAQARQAS